MHDIDTAIEHLRRGDWQAAHEIVQRHDSPHACWAHGIVHVMEGDLGNARYWYRRAGRDWADPVDVPAEIKALEAAASQ